MIMRRIIHQLFLATLCGMSSLRAADAPNPAADAPKPPQQPESGPGGKEVLDAAVTAESRGSGAQAYWLFEPAKPAPKTAPLIVFNHGWAAMDPRIYMAWINHIVERGNIVVFPLYQDSLLTPMNDFTPNAIAAVQDAIHTLQTEPGHVKPELGKFAIVGHSMGGAISANMAALCKARGLPLPGAVMCVEPGKTWGPAWATIQLEDLSQIPSTTLLLTVTGDQDQVVLDIDAKRIFKESTQVPPANKSYVTLISDGHGQPALNASHLAPIAFAPLPSEEKGQSAGAPGATAASPMPAQGIEEKVSAKGDMPGSGAANGTIDALDFFGTWKLLDGLTDAAFYNRNRKYALGDTPEQRFMGLWSDGVPVKEMRVTDHP